MEAWFCAQALWRLVSGASTAARVSQSPKDREEEKLEAWQVKADKAAGIMWLMVENTQRVHFRGIKDDPLKMWDALREVHMQKRHGTRFNAYDDLFLIRKRDEDVGECAQTLYIPFIFVYMMCCIKLCLFLSKYFDSSAITQMQYSGHNLSRLRSFRHTIG